MPRFGLYSGTVVEDHDDDAWVVDDFAGPGYRRCHCSGYIRTLVGDHDDALCDDGLGRRCFPLSVYNRELW